MFVVIKANPIV